MSGMSDLAGWVGMEALSEADARFEGGAVTLAPDVPPEADRAVLIIRNENGSVVLREDIPLNSRSYSWDGRTGTGSTAAYGAYSFELEASAAGQVLSVSPVASYARVIEARREADSTMLVLQGGSKVAAESVTGLRSPGSGS